MITLLVSHKAATPLEIFDATVEALTDAGRVSPFSLEDKELHQLALAGQKELGSPKEHFMSNYPNSRN